MMSDYLDSVTALTESARKQTSLDIARIVPSFDFTENTVKKLIIKEQLNPNYRVQQPSSHWAYSNYNSLNFFTASSVPSDSALLYPMTSAGPTHEGYITGSYVLSGPFSFDFYINPRYRSEPDADYKAGTIMQLSASYALSVITGSACDENGRAIGFRLQLQLSHSACTSPSLAVPGIYPNDLVFLSDDNALTWNKWHHVIVRWGTNVVNDGTGSFNIDGIDRGTFVIPSGTIASLDYGGPPTVLTLGNYYDGPDDMKFFFAADPALRDGLNQLDATTGVDVPASFTFDNQLNAELHDVSIKRFYMTDVDIAASASMGMKYLDNQIAFYVPPFYVENSPFRQYVNDHGGVLQTPFLEIDGTTADPFNVAMSFGVGGHYINIENFVKDFANNVFPRVYMMTGSAIANTTQARSANDFLYDDPLVRRRNLFLMPCDDGQFIPAFDLLVSESKQGAYTDDNGVSDLSLINLDNMVMSQSLVFGTSFYSSNKTTAQVNELANESIGFTPETPGFLPGRVIQSYISKVNKSIASGTFDAGIQDDMPLTIYQRTRDPSSNQITMYDISNLFYGKQILPGSFEMTDMAFTGSAGTMSITLKDDGFGNIYRADCVTSQSSWNSVGNIYYSEGLILIKSPHLYFFGQDQVNITFKGDQNVHVLKLDSIAPANQLNSSSNPDFMPVSASLYANDTDKDFVYITGINFHDDNMNVVMKTRLAQPIMKRHGDSISFRTRIDF